MAVIENAAWANRATLLRPVANKLRALCDPRPGWRQLDVDLGEADAERLPFEDGSFDAVLSTFGAMFWSHHQGAADELTRVLAPGGTLALAAWTPESFVGELLRAIAACVPAPALAASLLWGSPGYAATLLGREIACLGTRTRWLTFGFDSAEALVDYFRYDHAPTATVFASLDPDAAVALADELVDRVRWIAGEPGPVVLPAAWLQTVGARV